MTKTEFLGLKEHLRIKYIGIDKEVISQLGAHKNKAAEKKGYVVKYIFDDGDQATKDHWGSSRGGKGVYLHVWNGPTFYGIKPEDWELADDKRVDLQRSRERREIRMAKKIMNQQLNALVSGYDFKYRKRKIDRALGDLPITAKFKLLADLTEEQRMWYQVMQLPIGDVTKAIKVLTDE